MPMLNFPSLNFHLGETIDLLRATCSNSRPTTSHPRGGHRSGERFPPEPWRRMGDIGLLGITVEEEYGGTAMGYLAHVIAMEEISRASASVGLSYGAHSNLCATRSDATAASRRREISAQARLGRTRRSVAMSEPGAGSDVVSMRLRADRRGDHFVLNGNKCGSPTGPMRTRSSSTPKPTARRDRAAFRLPDRKGHEGFSTAQKLDKLGMRGSNTCELVFQDCEVPEENVLSEEGRGVNVLMSGLDYERAVLAGGPLGIMDACMDIVLPYVHERQQFGQPIGEFQLMQGKVADSTRL